MANWAAVIAAALAAGGSLLAAIFSARSAATSRQSQVREERILDLERRLAGMKAEIYTPIIDLLARMLASGGTESLADDDALPTLHRFITWVQIYGSDDVVQVTKKLMQASYASAPPLVLLRYYAEFIVAVRRDIGYPETKVSVVDLFALRINDIYPDMAQKLALDEEEFLADVPWRPPWS